MGIEIRPRRDADLPALGEVLVRVHRRYGYPVEGVADAIGWLTPPRLLMAWSAICEGPPVGHAALVQAAIEEDAARVWHGHTGASIERLAIPVRMFVDPEHRRHGVGGMFMRTVEEYGRQHGLALASDVMLKDEAAIRLYETAGYRPNRHDHAPPQRRSERARRCLRHTNRRACDHVAAAQRYVAQQSFGPGAAP